MLPIELVLRSKAAAGRVSLCPGSCGIFAPYGSSIDLPPELSEDSGRSSRLTKGPMDSDKLHLNGMQEPRRDKPERRSTRDLKNSDMGGGAQIS